MWGTLWKAVGSSGNEVVVQENALPTSGSDILNNEVVVLDKRKFHSDTELSLNAMDDERFEFDNDEAKSDDEVAYDVIDMYTGHKDAGNGDDMNEEHDEINHLEVLDSILPVFNDIEANGTRSGGFDRYGFRKESKFVTEKEYDTWWDTYSRNCIKRKFKWEQLLLRSGILVEKGSSPEKFPCKSEKLRKLVYRGIPAEWRGNAWWNFCRGQELLNKNKGKYQTILRTVSEFDELRLRGKSNSVSKTLPDLDIIERDLNRTFPDNIHFQKEPFQDKSPPMIISLRNVLVAFSLYNPKIGYCQSMNFLAGLLLLFVDEERAFWMLVIITTRYLPGVHSTNLEGVNIEQGILMLCVREHLPGLWPYIEMNHISGTSKPLHLRRTNEFLHRLPPLAICTASWFMCCFVGTFPIETTLRIWDCLFYEESSILFKISLGILNTSEQELIKGKPYKSLYQMFTSAQNSNQNLNISDDLEVEIFQALQTLPKRIIDADKFLHSTLSKRFSSISRISQVEIRKYRNYVVSQRSKYKRYTERFGLDFDNHHTKVASRTSHITDEMIKSTLSNEIEGFQVAMSGAKWNDTIKNRIKNAQKVSGNRNFVPSTENLNEQLL